MEKKKDQGAYCLVNQTVCHSAIFLPFPPTTQPVESEQSACHLPTIPIYHPTCCIRTVSMPSSYHSCLPPNLLYQNSQHAIFLPFPPTTKLLYQNSQQSTPLPLNTPSYNLQPVKCICNRGVESQQSYTATLQHILKQPSPTEVCLPGETAIHPSALEHTH